MDTKQKKENKIVFIGIGIILLISVFSLLRSNPFQKKEVVPPPVNKTLFTDYEYITAEDLDRKILSGATIALIDTRDKLSFEKNHIQNSINILPENLKEKISNFNKEDFLVIIGYDFERKKDEAQSMQIVKEAGFKNALALSGGAVGWASQGNAMIGGGNKESVLDWSKIDYILPEQLKLAIDNAYPVAIIDVRPSFMFSSGHIPSATNIPLDELEKRKMEIPLSKEILVYGATADDDFKASVKLNDLGLLATYTLKGGFAAWQEKRFELVK